MSSKLEDKLLPVLLDAFEDRARSTDPVTRRPRRRWKLAIPIVAGGLALAIVVPLVLPHGRGGADPAAAAALHRVALRAAAQPAVAPPQAGQFVYTKTESTDTSTYVTGNGPDTNFMFTSPLTREAWIGTDGSGRIRETAGAITFPTDADRARWVAAGSPDLNGGRVTDHEYQAGGLYYLDTTALPDDPQALRQLIEQRGIVGGPKGDWETFSIVGDLLRETSVQPAVRGALYEVAADLPGVEYVGKIKDASGRPGIAVAYTHNGIRQEFIFDPQTAELLGENYVLVEDSSVDVESGGPGSSYGLVGPAGTLAYTATYLASGITDSTNERP